MVDTSVTLAWCFEDEQDPAALHVLDRVAEDGAWAPQLWPIESLNGLLTAERRGRIDATVRFRLAEFLRALPIRIDDETSDRVWGSTAQLAGLHGLTAYDATYLELALRLGVPLATRDAALVGAARAAGVPLLSGAAAR